MFKMDAANFTGQVLPKIEDMHTQEMKLLNHLLDIISSTHMHEALMGYIKVRVQHGNFGKAPGTGNRQTKPTHPDVKSF